MTAPQACASCDGDTQLTSQGLCSRCQSELRFVVRPAAHRETYRRRIAAQTGIRDELERLGVVIISSVPQDNDLWICDLCNSQIPVEDEYTLIPLLGSHALCTPCVTTIRYWPEAWMEPTPRPCRCGACQTPVLEASIRKNLRQERGLDGPGSGRGIER